MLVFLFVFFNQAPWPLDIIISTKTREVYNQVFVFLLQIKYAKYSLDKLLFSGNFSFLVFFFIIWRCKLCILDWVFWQIRHVKPKSGFELHLLLDRLVFICQSYHFELSSHWKVADFVLHEHQLGFPKVSAPGEWDHLHTYINLFLCSAAEKFWKEKTTFKQCISYLKDIYIKLKEISYFPVSRWFEYLIVKHWRPKLEVFFTLPSEKLDLPSFAPLALQNTAFQIHFGR